MASAHDVAAYILEQQPPMSSMKLQKLLYYAQAWHLVWDEEPLFSQPIEAWANGPVVYSVFSQHRGRFKVTAPWPKGSGANLTPSERGTVDAVLDAYGDLSGRQLSALTHDESPWREAREGCTPTGRSRKHISLDRMLEFYSGLVIADDAQPVDQLVWDDLV